MTDLPQSLPQAWRPPMGWNSWDSYGTTLTEDELLANARFMAEHLKNAGWDTLVIDIDWYDPTARAHGYNDTRSVRFPGIISSVTLPGGYQMELNEDASNVSQGQKQLLTIARTILADNRILILDEATSSVDTRTEQRIQTAMDRLMQGRTSFVIAHRLSTIRDADLILVMREGDIVEQGTHDELIEAGGFYADLYNSQFEDVTA